MIHKPGRIPYDSNSEDRYCDYGQKEAPVGYQSIQKNINSSPDGTLDPDKLLPYLKKIKSKGFKQMEPDEIYEVKLGSRMAYITTDNKWRSGGFLVDIRGSDEADAVSGEYKTYLLYKAFSGVIFSLQLDDVLEFWIKEKSEIKSRRLHERVVFRVPPKEDRIGVYLEDDEGNDVIVKYCRNNYDYEIFISTEKFKQVAERGWMFDDGTQFNSLQYESENLNVVLRS